MNAKTRQIGRISHRGWLASLAPALALALTLGSSLDTHAAERVYKWTDENGTVHFTSTPPPGSQAERVKLRKAPPAPTAETTSTSSSQGELYAESEEPDNSAIEEENRRTRRLGFRYSRYADDMAFSGDARLARRASNLASLVGAIALEEGFHLNHR
ncbi:MAG: DUF4124 domain-containing protein, partial [Pseudomonadota bacterium]